MGARVRRLVPILAVILSAVLVSACAGTPRGGDGAPDIAAKAERGMKAAGLHSGPSVSFESFYALPADIHNERGEVAVAEAQIGLNGGVPLGKFGFLGLESSYEWRSYQFNDLERHFDGDDSPVGDFHTVDLVGSWVGLLGTDIKKDWGIVARLGVRSSVEAGADFGDGLSGLGLVIFGKQVHKKLRLGVGLGVATRLDDDAMVIPALGLDWEITDSIRARIVGPGLEVTKRLDPERTIALIARYDFRTFRLDDDGAGKGGIFEDDRIPVMLRFTQSLGESSELGLYLGADVVRRLELLDDDGDRIDRVSTDLGVVLGASVNFGF